MRRPLLLVAPFLLPTVLAGCTGEGADPAGDLDAFCPAYERFALATESADEADELRAALDAGEAYVEVLRTSAPAEIVGTVDAVATDLDVLRAVLERGGYDVDAAAAVATPEEAQVLARLVETVAGDPPAEGNPFLELRAFATDNCVPAAPPSTVPTTPPG